MARTRQTARKSTSVRPRPVQSGGLDTFYSFKMEEHQSISWFLRQFMQRWKAVRDLGVTELDGVIQLALALPPQWRPWAAEETLNFVHPDMEYRVTGNLVAFVEYIKDQYRPSDAPPSCLYTPLDPHEFILVIHQVLDDILHTPMESVELGANEALGEETEPEECSDDIPIQNPNEDVRKEEEIGEDYTPLDLDLYEQPFALNSPSPPLFPLTPLLEDLPESFLSSIGTSTLQPLSISEMGTDSFTFVAGGPSSSNVGGTPTAAEDRTEVSDEGKEVIVDEKEASD